MLARKAPGVAQGFEQQLAEVAKALPRKVRGLGPQAAEPGEAVQQQIAIAHLPGRDRIAEVAPEVGIAIDGRAKIQQHQLIAGGAAADQIIAEVGVRLQHPPLVQFQEKQLQHRLAEGVAARLGKPRHFGLGDPITADVLQRQHGIGAVVLGHPGHIVGAARRSGEALVRDAGHRQFAGVIDLAVQLAAHFCHPGVHIAAGFDPAGEQQEAHNGVEIVIDQRSETGILHLEHEIAVAALTARAMHLGQRSRRQRLRIDAQIPVARPEALAHRRLQFGPGQRLRLRIEIVQGFGERRGQEVLTEQREHLPDLHVAAFEAAQFRRKAPRFTAHQFIAFAVATAQPVQRRTQGQRAPGAQPRHGNRQPAADAAALYCRVFTHALHTRRLGIRIQGVSGSALSPAPPNCPRQWLTRIQALWIS